MYKLLSITLIYNIKILNIIKIRLLFSNFDIKLNLFRKLKK